MRSSSSWRRVVLAVIGALLLALVVPAATGASRALAQGNSVTISPTQGPPGTEVTATGSGWAAGDTIQAIWGGDTGTDVGSPVVVNSSGGFTLTFAVPSGTAPGSYQVIFWDETGRTFVPATTPFSVGCPTNPSVTFTPTSGLLGASFTITGTSWVPGGTVTSGLPNGSPGWFTGYQAPTVDAAGHFSFKETVGTGPNGPTPPGDYPFTFSESQCSLKVTADFTVLPEVGVQNAWVSGYFLLDKDTSASDLSTSGGRTWYAPNWHTATQNYTPGEQVRYTGVAGNLTGASATIALTYKVTGPGGTIFSWGPGSVTLGSGWWTVTVVSSIPLNAAAGTYTLKFTASLNGYSASWTSTLQVVGPIRTRVATGTSNSVTDNTQCTWLAAQEWGAFDSGRYPPALGASAYEWAADAQADGWTVSSTPEPNSVVVFPQGVDNVSATDGHVAWFTGLVSTSTSGGVTTWVIDVYQQNPGTPNYAQYTINSTQGVQFILVP